MTPIASMQAAHGQWESWLLREAKHAKTFWR
jgi:hypothetical protein